MVVSNAKATKDVVTIHFSLTSIHANAGDGKHNLLRVSLVPKFKFVELCPAKSCDQYNIDLSRRDLILKLAGLL